MSASRDKDVERKKESAVTTLLAAANKKNKPAFYQYITGNLNPSVPRVKGDPFTGCFAWGLLQPRGIYDFFRALQEKAEATNESIVSAWLGPRLPVFYVCQVAPLWALSFQKRQLAGVEAGSPIQKTLFNDVETFVALQADDERYARARFHLTNTTLVHSKLALLAQPMMQAINPYIALIKQAADAKRSVDLVDLASRIALTAICKSLLGIHEFPIKYRTKIINIVHQIMSQLPLLGVISRIYLQSMLPSSINVISSITKLLDEGESLIKTLIDFNEKTVIDSLRSIHNPDLKQPEEELCDPDAKQEKVSSAEAAKEKLRWRKVLSFIELVKVGGYDSTKTFIQYAIVEMANPDNREAVDKFLAEIAMKQKKSGKTELSVDDLKEMPYSQAFLMEVLRLHPSFSVQRVAVAKDLYLPKTVDLPEDIGAYTKKSSAEKEEILAAALKERKDINQAVYMPPGSIVFLSLFHAQRSAKAYSNPLKFNPDRWLNEKGELIMDLSENSLTHNPIFHTFGTGVKRKCPGRLVAFQEAMLTMIAIATRFKVTTDFNPETVEVGLALGLKPGTVIRAKFTEREQGLEAKESNESRSESVFTLSGC